LLAHRPSSTQEEVVKLLDFGIAKMTDLDLTQTGSTLGTAAYMSPEQAIGEKVDGRTDLWSIGVLLYEMLTGQRPFKGGTGHSVVNAILNFDPVPVESIRGGLPDSIASVVDKALLKDLDRRFQSADELIGALTGIDETSLGTGENVQTVDTPNRRTLLLMAGTAAVVVVVFVLIWLSPRSVDSGGPGPEIPIAVLPFVSVGEADSVNFLGDAFADGLILSLSRAGLKVPVYRSVSAFRGPDRDVRAIGKALGAERVLLGNVRQDRDQLRIDVQVFSSDDGRESWSDSFNGNADETIDLQRQITTAVLQQLLPIGDPLAAPAATVQTTSNDAYLLYFKGRYFWNKRTEAGLRRSIDLYRQALDLDPTYARAWAGLGDSYVLLGNWGFVSPIDAYPLARAALETALELDPLLAEAHTALAFALKDYYWEWDAAEQHFLKAIELQPDDATAHQQYAVEYLSLLGRHEQALRHIDLAASLDPLSLIIQADAGRALTMAGEPERSIERLIKVVERDPEFFPAQLFLGIAYLHADRLDEAIATIRKSTELSRDSLGPGANSLAYLAVALATAGREADAREVVHELEELADRRHVMAYWQALPHVALGEFDEAFELLERSYDRREPILVYIKENQLLDALRRDSRARDLLARMGLE
jgi:TolB-like protein/Tfp pilus assembly protein PilF